VDLGAKGVCYYRTINPILTRVSEVIYYIYTYTGTMVYIGILGIYVSIRDNYYDQIFKHLKRVHRLCPPHTHTHTYTHCISLLHLHTSPSDNIIISLRLSGSRAAAAADSAVVAVIYIVVRGRPMCVRTPDDVMTGSCTILK